MHAHHERRESEAMYEPKVKQEPGSRGGANNGAHDYHRSPPMKHDEVTSGMDHHSRVPVQPPVMDQQHVAAVSRPHQSSPTPVAEDNTPPNIYRQTEERHRSPITEKGDGPPARQPSVHQEQPSTAREERPSSTYSNNHSPVSSSGGGSGAEHPPPKASPTSEQPPSQRVHKSATPEAPRESTKAGSVHGDDSNGGVSPTKSRSPSVSRATEGGGSVPPTPSRDNDGAKQAVAGSSSGSTGSSSGRLSISRQVDEDYDDSTADALMTLSEKPVIVSQKRSYDSPEEDKSTDLKRSKNDSTSTAPAAVEAGEAKEATAGGEAVSAA